MTDSCLQAPHIVQEESVNVSDDEETMAPKETFLSRAYHSNAICGNEGDADYVEAAPITEYSQEIASELLSPGNQESYSESVTYCNYYLGVIANEEQSTIPQDFPRVDQSLSYVGAVAECADIQTKVRK
mmetsp:Transcript_8113/g.11264  ORF Transcript_8113/g.11264 Transcript_8113/m.11264 type:complete len:129 (+) Transcript_8113:246-632(+)